MNFFSNFRSLLSAVFSATDYEVKALVRVSKMGILFTLIISFLQLISHGKVPEILFFIALFFAYLVAKKLFSIPRLARITGAGEVAEIANLTETRSGLHNFLIDTYFAMSWVVVIMIIFAGGAIAWIPLWEKWWLFIVWPFILLGIVLLMAAWSRKLVWALAMVMFLAVCVYTINSTWPNLLTSAKSGIQNIGQKSGVDQLALEYTKAAAIESAKMKAVGWGIIAVTTPDSNGYVEVSYPTNAKVGQTMTFQNFVYDAISNNGVPLFIPNGSRGFTIDTFGDGYMLVRPKNGTLPDIIWGKVK